MGSMNTADLKRKLVAEYLGSMILVMAAVSSTILFNAVFQADKGMSVIANALAVAFVLCALIMMFTPISGAHFNPVVTLSMRLDGKMSTREALSYIVVQIAGGLTGTALSSLMFLNDVGRIFSVSNIPQNEYAYFGEIFGTFILLLAILTFMKAQSPLLPLVVGLLVGGQILATSSTMFGNPQVTIARMFTNSAAGIMPKDGLIFIVMQIIGAVLAYLVYRYLLSGPKEDR